MSKYSCGGYRIAIQTKTKKTVLVEGKEDKELFNRLRLASLKETEFDIDTSEIFDDEAFKGLGAKSKIDLFLDEISSDSPISNKLRAFLDREWEDLIDADSNKPLPWTPPNNSTVRLTTAGHSIENYGFCREFITAYMAHFGCDLCTSEKITSVSDACPALFRFAAALSQVARDHSSIGRCRDILRICDVDWNGNRFSLNPGFLTQLIQRQVNGAEYFISDVENEQLIWWNRPPFNQESRWHAHGHIGEMAIWAGIGRLLLDLGVDELICDELAYGRKDEKRRYWHTWILSQSTDSMKPLDSVFK